MKWISKYPPKYVALDDTWYNETIGVVYWPNMLSRCWISTKNNSTIAFLKGTLILRSRDNG